jgi:hypothetical protein
MLQEMIDALVRHALTGAAGVLVAHGFASNDQAQALVGGLMAAIGIYMSYKHKQQVLATKPPY